MRQEDRTMRRRIPLLIGALMLTVASAAAMPNTLNTDTPCVGAIWPCPPSCYRAEVISIDAGCTKPSQSHCCLYIYVTYACRRQPECEGQVCGNTREAPIKIYVRGECKTIPEGYRCGEHWVRNGGSNSVGFWIILPSRCGEPVTAVRVIEV